MIESKFICTGGSSTTKDVWSSIWGDGYRVGSEQWDDGNLVNGDGWSSNCKNEIYYFWSGGSSTTTCTGGSSTTKMFDYQYEEMEIMLDRNNEMMEI